MKSLWDLQPLRCPGCGKNGHPGSFGTSRRYGGISCFGCGYRVDGPRDAAIRKWNEASQRKWNKPKRSKVGAQ